MRNTKKLNYGFVGFGNLANAIARGLIQNKNISINFYDRNEVEYFDGVKKQESLADLIEEADIIFLTIKPQDLSSVLNEIKTFNLGGKIIISPVAGKQIRFLETHLGKNISIIRIMPNLCINYQKSITALAANQSALENKLFKLINEDLARLGEVITINEQDFDQFTAIYGCGPAFILKLFKPFIKNSNQIIGDKTVDSIVMLLEGTAAYLKSNKDLTTDNLIAKVASKGGVTEAGLIYAESEELEKRISNMLKTAAEKSNLLSQ